MERISNATLEISDLSLLETAIEPFARTFEESKRKKVLFWKTNLPSTQRMHEDREHLETGR